MQKFSLKILSLAMVGVLMVPLAAADPPANDDRDNAELLLLGATANTREATDDALDPCVMGKTVWYRLVVVAPVTITTAGSNFDTELGVYALGSDVAIDCDDDGGVGLTSKITISEPGIYDVQAGGYKSTWSGYVSSGDLVVNVA